MPRPRRGPRRARHRGSTERTESIESPSCEVAFSDCKTRREDAVVTVFASEVAESLFAFVDVEDLIAESATAVHRTREPMFEERANRFVVAIVIRALFVVPRARR